MDQRRETKRTGMPPEKLQPPLARSLGGGLRCSLPALCGFNDNGYKPRRTTTGLKGTRNLHPPHPFPQQHHSSADYHPRRTPNVARSIPPQ